MFSWVTKSLKESKNLIVEHLENVVFEKPVLIDEDNNETVLDAELIEAQGEEDVKDSKWSNLFCIKNSKTS